MASGAKKKASRSSGRRKKSPPTQARRQMWAVVLFALGLLLLALTIIEGDRLWRSIHSFIFGLFGWSAYFLPPLMIYISIITSLDKPLGTMKAKLWQMGLLVIMISGAIQIFTAQLPSYGNLVENVLALYIAGTTLSGGGVAGAVFAFPLIWLFDNTGASIIITLLIFVFVMLLTGATLISLYRYLSHQFKGLEETYAERIESAPPPQTRPEKKLPKAAAPPPSAAPRFNIDVPVDDKKESAPPEQSEPPPTSKQEEVVEEALPFIIEHKPAVQDLPVEYISTTKSISFPLEDEMVEPEDETRIDDIVGRFVEKYNDIDEHPPTTPLFDIPNPETSAVSTPSGEIQEYRRPHTGLLSHGKAASAADVTEELKQNAQTLVDTLKSFGVQTRITDICRGPAVTRYELQPSAGVKISKITGLSDDIALNLASAGIRIEAPIPNKAAVGIEVPNKNVSVVGIRDILESEEFAKSPASTTVSLGKDIAGNIVIADIGKMPHVLIAGATGSGKSVCINSIIMSLLYKSSPDEVKLLMIDPKVVELGVYNSIPHLLVPVVTDPKKAAGALGWAVGEMLGRYKTFAAHSVRDLAGYNRLAQSSEELAHMPKIVIIIDELADLMMAAPGEVEDSICRLAQMARAAGMHLVIATQRPSVDVITGVIKANIPSRIAFAVSSQVDSRTILDMGGAEKLLGRGDMLFYPVGASKPQRVQGCFVTDSEVEAVVSYIKDSSKAIYSKTVADEIDRYIIPEKSSKGASSDGDGDDEMLPQAIECVVEAGQASTSQLQRRLKLGYARAARVIDQLEQKGIVGPFEGSKPRQVLISKDRWMEMKLSGMESTQLKSALPQGEAPF